MPTFAYVGMVDGAVQYRYGTKGEAAWWECPVTRDRAHIRQIADLFNDWYDYLGLPAAIEDMHARRRHAPIDRSDKMALILRYLDNGDPDFLHDVLGAPDEDDIIFWVDWREDEVDIIHMCETVLLTGALSARYLPNAVSADLEITYRGKTVIARYPDGVAHRDTTLLALNAILSPDVEIRYCMDSSGSDTAALLPLNSAQWAKLESVAPDAVRKAFRPLSPNMPIFK